MADFYFDSSALVKRYISESGTSWVTGLFDPPLGHNAFIAAITPVEMIAAIARRARGKSITQDQATTAYGLIRSDLQTGYQVVELNEAVLTSAMRLAESYALRGYDAVQLAGALEINTLLLNNDLPPLIFVSADAELNDVAAAEGLVVENPKHHA